MLPLYHLVFYEDISKRIKKLCPHHLSEAILFLKYPVYFICLYFLPSVPIFTLGLKSMPLILVYKYLIFTGRFNVPR